MNSAAISGSKGSSSAARLAVSALILIVASSCAKKERDYLPVVARVGDTVKAISHEEAETICRNTECEPNQIYTASFGRKKKSPQTPPAVMPVKEPLPPTPDPEASPPPTAGQPAETMDYSRDMLGMDEAWKITEGSREVIVAVVDTGVLYDHPDLYKNVWSNAAERNGVKGVDDDGNGYVDDVYGYDFYNDRGNGYDDGGHGTHCAGIIGASKNGIGVRGVSPLVKIMPLKFLGKGGSGDTADAVSAINYAVRMGAKVISNSWGGGGPSKFLREAIDNARAKGVIVVAAAGNNSTNIDVSPSYPASYPGVIAVGSTDSRDHLSAFSNYGRMNVMIHAPGSFIHSTYLRAGYSTISGTSMAAPQVSGAIALALALKRDLTENEIKADLCDSSSKAHAGTSACGRMHVGDFIQRVSTR